MSFPGSNKQTLPKPGAALQTPLFDSVIDSLLVCENIFTTPPRPNGWRCYNFQGNSKSQRASKSHYWFKSYGDFPEWVDFAYWWSCIGKGLLLQPRKQACLEVFTMSFLATKEKTLQYLKNKMALLLTLFLPKNKNSNWYTPDI